jgi:hypothetical protein
MGTDSRARVALNGKPIDLAQLAAEVGTELTASAAEVVVADEDSAVTAAALQAALEAHTPAAAVDHDAEFRNAVQAATTLDALKAALLGVSGPGAQPRRPDGR